MKHFKLLIYYKNQNRISKNFSKYEDVIEEYNSIKNSCEFNKIEILKSENDIETMIFTKKYSDTKIKNTNDILEDLKKIHNEVSELKNHHHFKIIVADRKRELNLHLLNSLSTLKLTDSEKVERKLNIINDLEYWENIRRISKNELSTLNSLNLDMENIVNNGVLNDNNCIIIDKDYYERTISYNTDEELNYILENNFEYAHHKISSLEKLVYFYNKFDRGKSLAEFKKSKKKEKKLKVSANSIEEPIVKINYTSFKNRMKLITKHQPRYKHMYDCTIRKCLFFSNTIELDINTAK